MIHTQTFNAPVKFAVCRNLRTNLDGDDVSWNQLTGRDLLKDAITLDQGGKSERAL